MCFVRTWIVVGNLRQPGHGRFKIVCAKINFPQVQERQIVRRLQTDCFLEAFDLFRGAAGKNSADVVLQRVQPQGLKLADESIFCLRIRELELVEHVPCEGGLYGDQAGEWR